MFILDFLGTTDLIEQPKTENWLEDALNLDVYAGSTYPQVKDLTDDLFKEISKRININNKPRSKETLKMILLNLWVGYHFDKPINYSRSPNSYAHNRRYGKLHFKYNRVIPIIDTLVDMGLLKQVKGFFDRDKDLGRRTRMCASDDLIKMFNKDIPGSFEVIERLPRREIIELKDEAKNLIDYKENEHTVNMRRNLHQYNQFIKNQKMDFIIPSDIPLKLKYLKNMKCNLLKGMIEINKILLNKDTHINSISINPLSKYKTPYISNIDTSIYHNIDYSSITTMTNKVFDLLKDNNDLLEKNEEFRLCDLGINFLCCEIRYELLHRVFNNESFDCGGRFFGAGHLELPKEVRKYRFTINNNPTVELDFSAMHIRMLYHLECIPYTDDPYSILCDNDEERNIYKLAQLIAINALNEKKALMAIRNEFRKKRIKYDLTNQSIGKLLTKFKEVHQPIAKYINTGKGLELQNLDSQITEMILFDLMKEGIPVLPVHDSYIVDEAYQGILAEKMVEAYEKVMGGFSPVIG